MTARRRNNAAHPIEKIGGELRSMMPWIAQNKIVDKDKNQLVQGFVFVEFNAASVAFFICDIMSRINLRCENIIQFKRVKKYV